MSEGDSPMTDAEVEAVARAIAGAAGLPIVPQCECRTSARAATAALDAARASEAWRYEIQHGPDGEAAYAWLYRGDEMVGTMRTHHAAAICAARGTVTAAEVERLARVACEAFGFEPIEGIQVRTVWADMVRAILRAQGRKLEGE